MFWIFGKNLFYSSILQSTQASREHPIVHRATGLAKAHRLLRQIAIRWRPSRSRKEEESPQGEVWSCTGRGGRLNYVVPFFTTKGIKKRFLNIKFKPLTSLQPYSTHLLKEIYEKNFNHFDFKCKKHWEYLLCSSFNHRYFILLKKKFQRNQTLNSFFIFLFLR